MHRWLVRWPELRMARSIASERYRLVIHAKRFVARGQRTPMTIYDGTMGRSISQSSPPHISRVINA